MTKHESVVFDPPSMYDDIDTDDENGNHNENITTNQDVDGNELRGLLELRSYISGDLDGSIRLLYTTNM